MNLDPVSLDGVTYYPDTGVFFHQKRGRIDRPMTIGYRCVRVWGCRYYAHRLAWYMVNGEWPPEEIDHINGDPQDNRLSNLRLATRAQNCANVVKKTGASGVYGVTKPKSCRRFRAFITVQSKFVHLGYFDSAEEAAAVSHAARESARGEYSPSGRVQK